MPTAKEPNKLEFYVYHLYADGIPFYVGIGRSARASDRIRYVNYLIRREKQGKPVKWCLSNRVIANLIFAGCNIEVVYPAKYLTRMDALKIERDEINTLIEAGRVLANIQYNSQKPESYKQVVESVLTKGLKKLI